MQREDDWSEVTDFVEFFFGIELPALNFLDDGAVLLVGYLFDGLDYRPGPLIRNNEVGEERYTDMFLYGYFEAVGSVGQLDERK